MIHIHYIYMIHETYTWYIHMIHNHDTYTWYIYMIQGWQAPASASSFACELRSKIFRLVSDPLELWWSRWEVENLEKLDLNGKHRQSRDYICNMKEEMLWRSRGFHIHPRKDQGRVGGSQKLRSTQSSSSNKTSWASAGLECWMTLLIDATVK